MQVKKAGNFRSWFAVVIFILVFGFVSIFSTLIYQNFITNFQTTGLYDGITEEVGNKYLNTFKMYDYLIIFVLFALIIGVGITSYKIATTPIFFVITMIMGVFLGLISYFFNYIFIMLISPAVFDSITVYFPRTIIICTNLHWVMLLCIIVGSITLYAKKEQGQYLNG